MVRSTEGEGDRVGKLLSYRRHDPPLMPAPRADPQPAVLSLPSTATLRSAA